MNEQLVTELCCCGMQVPTTERRGERLKRRIPSSQNPTISRAVEDYLLGDITLRGEKSLNLDEYPFLLWQFCKASNEDRYSDVFDEVLHSRKRLSNSKNSYLMALSRVQALGSSQRILSSDPAHLILIPLIDL
jgi:hypothetical protein